MIINYNIKELLRATKYMSTLERIKFVEDLKKKDKIYRRMEKTLEKGSNIATKYSSPKKWSWNHNDIFN